MRCVFINGTVGVGKTSVSEEVGDRLTLAGVPNAVIDLDWLRRAWPAPGEDPFNQQLELDNLSAITPNFSRAGVEVMVLAGVIERAEDRVLYEAALRDSQLTVLRLDAPLGILHQRLQSRHAPGDSALNWHLNRAGELQSILSAADVDDAVIDTGDLDVKATAAVVLGLANLR